MKHVLAICCLVCLGALVPRAPARAQVESREGIMLQNQIAELRHEVELLREQLASGGGGGSSSLGGSYSPPPQQAEGAGGDMVAQLLVRVQELEEKVRGLSGRIDESDNARQRQAEDLAKQIGDLSFKLENGGAAASGGGTPPAAAGAQAGAPPPPPPSTPGGPLPLSPPPGNLTLPSGAASTQPAAPPPPPPPPPVRRTPEMILLEGNTALARKDYAAAEAAARAALAAGGPRGADAELLLARASFGKRDYPDAAIAYDEAYKRAPSGAHAQDARLGLAASLAALGDRKAACGALEKLAAEFPTLRADLRPTAASLRHENACH